MDWAPVTRNVLRYLIGFLVSFGIVPSGLAEMISSDPLAIDALNTGLCLGAGVCVERAYYLAKKHGWST